MQSFSSDNRRLFVADWNNSMVVNLGPKGTVLPDVPKNPREDGLGSNPRCLRRDVNRNSALGATANYTYSLIMNYTDINGFYNRYLGLPPLKNDQHPWGVSTRSLLPSRQMCA